MMMEKALTSNPERRLSGIPVSPGIAIGQLRVQARDSRCPDVYTITLDDVDDELARFHEALALTAKQMQVLRDRIVQMSGEKDGAIFDAHLLFLQDKVVLKKVERELVSRLQNVEYVFYAVIQNYLEVMRKVDDTYLRSRSSDMEDIMNRVLQNMRADSDEDDQAEDEQHILVAFDLTPSDTAAMNVDHVLGFATEVGSAVSHTSILARSMGIPAVVGIEDALLETSSLQKAILDGYTGVLILNPTDETVESYHRLQKEKEKAYRALEAMRDLPTETLDGHHIRLAVNVEFPHEFGGIKDVGAEGVGLFRTEFFLLGSNKVIPGEDAQTKGYSELVKGCYPHEVVFRTLDAGGDKLPSETLHRAESNPFLGWRGIRVSLSRRDLFKDQLKAILRASVHGPTGVMFPMISGLTEVLQAKSILQECRNELDAIGVPYGKDLKVGIMIEVPSAAIMADILASEVDFFSVGTNDLTQYAIAVDRVNSYVAHMFRPTHPGVIRLIDMTVKAGVDKGVPTAICGEMAGDILLLPLLIGLGARELSVGVHLVPVIRYAIRNLNYRACREMAEMAIKAPDSNTVLKLSSGLAHESYPSLFE
ncbi:MAG: phosphoenolpyruvate--protein phosphotransferase [Akkermansia sp.]